MEFSAIVLSYLAGVSARSLGLVAIAVAVVWVGRVKSASARHAVWTMVAAGMLLLAALNPVLPSIPVRVLRTVPELSSTLAIPDQALDTTQAGAALSGESAGAWMPSWTQALLSLYLIGALALIARFLFGYLFTRRLVRASRPIDREIPLVDAALLESSWISAPMTVGWIRPKVLLPIDWREWDAAKLNAVLAHELTHVRRADWLVAALARLNRSLFWFHPLAWWLERRLASLAEQACDDSALLVVGDRDQYARALLDMATAVKAARGRLVWHAIAMAEPAEVGSRIDRILDETRPIPQGLTRSRRMAMAVCSLPLLYAASVLQLAPTQAVGQESRNFVTESPYLRSLIAGRQLTAADVAAQERYLATNPEDLVARGRLIAYYFMNAVREPRLTHILWLIERHPESELAGFASAGISPRAGVLNDEADYERARSLWRRQSSQYASDVRVVGNALQFYLQPGGDFDEAERLLKSARVLDPKQQAFTDQLASLYTRVILGSAIGHGPGVPGGMGNPAFAERVKSELEISTDGPLLSATGTKLASTARSLSQAPNLSGSAQLNSLMDLGERLSRRSEQFGIRQIPAPAPRAAAPPPQIQATAVRPLSVDGPTQATKLVKRVEVEYPELAKQARIQGVVRLATTVGKDGTVIDIKAMSGHPLLVPAALAAVRHYVYQPTLLNGQPVEVLSTVEVNFTLSQQLDTQVRDAAGNAVPIRIRVGGNVQATMILDKVNPVYPSLAKQERIEGVVRLGVTIGADGRVRDLQLLEGHPLLAEAAQAAVSQWVYRPTLLNGDPVEVVTVVDVNFTLSQ